MIQRCTNPKNPGWDDYGGRGITVCDHWRSFENFLADMGEPADGQSLDRANNALGYDAANCRWTSGIAQANNTRRNRILTFQGVSDTVAGWSRRTGIADGRLRSRLQNGWSIEATLTIP
jgi:hypothetical protein